MNAVGAVGWTVAITSLIWWAAIVELRERDRADRRRRDEAERWKRQEQENNR